MGLQNIGFAFLAFFSGIIFVLIMQQVNPLVLPLFDDMGEDIDPSDPNAGSILGDWAPFIKGVWLFFELMIIILLVVVMPVYWITTMNDTED